MCGGSVEWLGKVKGRANMGIKDPQQSTKIANGVQPSEDIQYVGEAVRRAVLAQLLMMHSGISHLWWW